MTTLNASKVATVQSVALTGFTGELIEVETDIKAGLPSLQIVGMGNKAIDEARQRVRSAITNSLLEFPARKVTVNLAPAELPKDGTHLDVPIALSILVASGQLRPIELEGAVFAGEVALDGQIRPIRGAIVVAETALTTGAHTVFVPQSNVAQARLVEGITVIGITSLKALFRHLKKVALIEPPPANTPILQSPPKALPSLDTIIGQEHAKRALAIAAAGRHNILLKGAPGAGKTLLAQALAGLLPPLVKQEVVEVTKIHSLAHSPSGAAITSPPFRAPHHSVTLSALIGGGLRPRPGDLSLAHKGVLFLDELPEYPRATLEALRQPLEDRVVHLSRLYGHVSFPADVLLAATMNPCPCGYYGDTHTACTCTAQHIAQYQKRLSGPLLDRIDLHVTVKKVDSEHFFNPDELTKKQHSKVLMLIRNARKMQHKRYKRSYFYNAHATVDDVRQLFLVQPDARVLLTSAAEKLQLSNRAGLRVLRVARTIADLDESPTVEVRHIAEALQFRH